MVKANDPEQAREALGEAMAHACACLKCDGDVPTVDILIAKSGDDGVVVCDPNDRQRPYARLWVDPQGVAHWEALRAA
jgi:hypothetical protein